MQVYWEVARRGFRRYATYRAATAAGVFTNTAFGFLQAYVLLAVYRSRTQVGGFDEVEALTYVFLTQGLLAPLDALQRGRRRAQRPVSAPATSSPTCTGRSTCRAGGWR